MSTAVFYKKNKIHRPKIDLCLDIINVVLLGLLAIATIYPFLYIIGISFNDGDDLLKGGVWLFPRVFTLDNYKTAFSDPTILTAFVITILRTVTGTVLSVILIAMMSYALIDKQLPGRKVLIYYFFITTLFSGGMIPFLILLRNLNLLDTFWVYIIPAIYSFYNMIIVRASFEAIPPSLAESARMDGAGDIRIFFQIYLPLSVPVLVTIALFTAVFHWNDWFAGVFYVGTPELKPAATVLQNIIAASMSNLNDHKGSTGGGSTPTPQSLQMAFVVIIVFPIVCVYPFVQKHFVKGVMIGSIKE